jgi:hypothetical protein
VPLLYPFKIIRTCLLRRAKKWTAFGRDITNAISATTLTLQLIPDLCSLSYHCACSRPVGWPVAHPAAGFCHTATSASRFLRLPLQAFSAPTEVEVESRRCV